MKINKIIIACFSFLIISLASIAQDKRTTETKVADLLARFPANDLQFNNKLMGDMLALGEAGQKLICDQIVAAGTGDDTRARFAIESFTRFVSQKGRETEKSAWEKTCINYALDKKDNGVKDFFMKQLQLIGGDASVAAMKIYLASRDMCEPALAVILAAGGKNAESVLAESLKNKDITCAASVMNALSKMNSQIAVNEYIIWSKVQDINTKASANNALAMSGSPLAYPVLSEAARGVEYRWEHTGATASLLNYANIIGKNGDLKTADKICKLVISKCNDNSTIQNKTAALSIYVGFHGIDAMPMLLKAAAHQNSKYRTAAMRISLDIPGTEVVNNWINYFPKAIPEAKPEIISMLGERGDELALPLVNTSLSAADLNTRKEASAAIVKISGNQSLHSLINYMLVFGSEADQEAAKSAIMSVAGNDNMTLLIPVLNEGPSAAKISAIEILAWSKDSKYFSSVFPLTSSSDEKVKAAAIKALASLAAASDQTKLIELLSATEKAEYISDIQSAIAAAAAKIENPEKRSEYILESLEKGQNTDPAKQTALKIKLIPVLAKTGGREALTLVNKEFENGNPEIRQVCFKTLTAWRD
jgi:HEAT repeat protein